MEGYLNVQSSCAHLDKNTSRLNEVVPSLYTDLGTTSLDDNVYTINTGISDFQLLLERLAGALRVGHPALALVDLGWAEDVRGGIGLGKFEAGLHDVDRDHAAGTTGAGNGHGKQTDGASAEDGDDLVRTDLGEGVDGMDTDCEGLDHRTVFERKVVGELICEVGGDAVVAAESTIIRWSCSETDVGAELGIRVSGAWQVDNAAYLVLASFASFTNSASRTWFDCDTCARFEMRYARTN